MKKNTLLFAAFAAILTCSCRVEQPFDVSSEEEGEITVLTAGFAGNDETKTVRQADGKVFWSPKDEISIVRYYLNKSDNKKFTSSNTEPSASATFTGTMPSGSGDFWAVYPYDSGNNVQVVSGYKFLVTTLPAEQEAVAGSFADDLFLSAAYVKSNAKTLTFHHMCGGVKFSVTQPGVKRVTLFPADEAVALAGLFGLYAEGAAQVPYIAITGTDEYMYNSVELTAPEGKTLEVGEAYHFVTMPAELKGGFTLLFEKEDGSIATRTVSKDVIIQAGHFATLMDADAGLRYGDVFEYSPAEITVDPRGGVFSLTIRSTVDYHVQISDDWIKEVGVKGDARIGVTLSYYAEPNDTGAERTGMLIVCDDKNCYPVPVTQGDESGLKRVVHHSLGMRFTASWCGYCPIMSETFKLAKANLGDKFEYVCVYATYQNSNYCSPVFDPLEDQYKISSWPTGIIDGRFLLENYDSEAGAQLIAQAVKETERYYPAVTTVGLESSVSGREVTAKVDVLGLAPDTYKLTVLLLENGIIGYQADYNNGAHQDFQHDRVARLCLTSSVTGDEFIVSEAGETESFTFTATVPSECNMDNLVILAYVQRPFGDRFAIQSDRYGDWYVDNCRLAAVGATAPIEVE